MERDKSLTGNEALFEDHELIVSKTDLKGRITYCNDVFIRVSGYSESELLGQPHNIIRHPEMPRCIFKLLWDTLTDGREIFAYVNNRSRNGDHYWVLAHVTPSRDARGSIVGYHSTRRVPDRRLLNNHIVPLYESLLAEERKHSDRKSGMESSFRMLTNILDERSLPYDEFIWRLEAA